MFVYDVYAWDTWSRQDGIGPPGTGVLVSCEPAMGALGMEPAFPGRATVLLNEELILSPLPAF